MYGTNELKSKIKFENNTVECPVLDCKCIVNRQRSSFKREGQYYCPTHKLFISPSTFEYESETDNLLNSGNMEISLLASVKKSKRESRITRERSEDALTWNVFRYLHNNGVLKDYIGSLTGRTANIIDSIYWSYSMKENCQWGELAKARSLFGENSKRGSEPDIIILTDTHVILFEAKFTSSNRTSGNRETLERRLINPKQYITSSNGLFSNIFKSNYESIVSDQKYELMRFWLLGNHIARKFKKIFILVNIVRESAEKLIENEFGKHIVQDDSMEFKRVSWESIGTFINRFGNNNADGILSYLKNKSIGYDKKGNLQKVWEPQCFK